MAPPGNDQRRPPLGTGAEKVIAARDLTSVPLTRDEEQELVQLEAVIETGLAEFVKVGNALAEINDKQLFRATHATFVEYAKDRFGLGRSHAYRVMDAARIVTELPSPIGDTIKFESQARALAGLPTKAAATVLIAAIDNTAGKPTAAAIADARSKLVPELPDAPASVPIRKRNRAPLPDAYRRAQIELGRVVRRLEQLHYDSRWRENRQAIATNSFRREMGADCDSLVKLVNQLDALAGDRNASELDGTR